jgi:hypothetical protein
LRYLKGTIDYGLRYTSDKKISLHGYVDSYWASSVVDQKSTFGCCFTLGSIVIAWFNRKQTSVALSTEDEEYIVACSTNKEVVCLIKFLAGLFDLKLETTCILCDNQSCMKLSENLAFHDKSKNIDIKYHYVWDMVKRGVVRI